MVNLLALFTLFFGLPLVAPCPQRELIYPCSCANSQIFCAGLENEQALSDVVMGLKNAKKFYSFSIEKSNFRYIPHDVFDNVKFQEFQISSSSFMALTDTDIAFEGLENDLVSLVITDSDVLNAWDWTVLRNLKELLKLHIDVDLTIVSKEIELISSVKLKDISLAKNQITYVHDRAFAGFKELLALSLRSNFITEVKRSMFSDPAPLLWKLDISHNQLQQLPSDLFENMPNLDGVSLESNKLMTLNEQTFKPVWSQLRYFDVMDNHIRCDCRMIWMTQIKFPEIMNGVCEQPKQLTSKKLKDLTEGDLWCFIY